MKTCKRNPCEVSKQVQMVRAHPGLFKRLTSVASLGFVPVLYTSNRFVYSYVCETKRSVRDRLLPVLNGFAVHLAMTKPKTKPALQPVGPWPQVRFHWLRFGSVLVFFQFAWPDLQALVVLDPLHWLSSFFYSRCWHQPSSSSVLLYGH
jgi:hypothetical protein